MGWVLVAGLWVLAGVTYVALRWIESRKQMDSMIDWALASEVKEEES